MIYYSINLSTNRHLSPLASTYVCWDLTWHNPRGQEIHEPSCTAHKLRSFYRNLYIIGRSSFVFLIEDCSWLFERKSYPHPIQLVVCDFISQWHNPVAIEDLRILKEIFPSFPIELYLSLRIRSTSQRSLNSRRSWNPRWIRLHWGNVWSLNRKAL